jgi:hypothetical protein
VLGERFVELLDELPMRYCASWRMRMAANMLREAGAVTGEDGQLLNHLEFDFESPIWRGWLRELSADSRLIR